MSYTRAGRELSHWVFRMQLLMRSSSLFFFRFFSSLPTDPGRKPKRLKLKLRPNLQAGWPPATRPLHSLRELPKTSFAHVVLSPIACPPDHMGPPITVYGDRFAPCSVSSYSISTVSAQYHFISDLTGKRVSGVGVVLFAYQVHRYFYLLFLSRSPETENNPTSEIT